MTFRKFALVAALALAANAANAAGTLTVDSIDADVMGSTDTFSGSISNSTGTLDGIWSFTLGTPTDGSVWSVYTAVIDFQSPFPSAVTASLNGVAGTLSQFGPVSQFTFGGTFAPGASALMLSGFGVGNGAVTMQATAVPEPETYAMMIAGLGAMGFLSRRRQRKG